MLSPEQIKKLTERAHGIRKDIVNMLIEAGSGHMAGSLGMTDIFTYLYFYALKHEPKNPEWPLRDRLVLSNGHICPAQYACMAESGYFPKEKLMSLRKFGSILQGHPDRHFLRGIETSSGPLGCGLSQTVGMALADRIDSGKGSPRHFYCLMSDGELDEGNTWEGVMLAGKEKIQNILAIIDRNNIQLDGYTEDVMPLNPLVDKWKSFNWHVQEIDGHNFEEIDRAILEAKSVFDRPSVIIAYTIPCKGIPQFERKYEWHGKVPKTEEEKEIARKI